MRKITQALNRLLGYSFRLPLLFMIGILLYGFLLQWL